MDPCGCQCLTSLSEPTRNKLVLLHLACFWHLLFFCRLLLSLASCFFISPPSFSSSSLLASCPLPLAFFFPILLSTPSYSCSCDDMLRVISSLTRSPLPRSPLPSAGVGGYLLFCFIQIAILTFPKAKKRIVRRHCYVHEIR